MNIQFAASCIILLIALCTIGCGRREIEERGEKKGEKQTDEKYN
jgi:hypothetical protein